MYLNNHYVGINKIRIERFLLKNKIKFKSLQIWRPYNLINMSYRKYSDHFHSLLFKIMFVQNVSATTLENAMKTLGDSGGAMPRNSGVYSINQVHNLNSQGQWGVNYPANDLTTQKTIANGFVKTGRLTLNGNYGSLT